ncbi:beta-galactosidase/beta-glucuronidase [Amycolatopsis bartoniae]|uniref:glycoside hydrolase family 2 protein n=1 Tax=Amycolatopsis bartoniae TaxID=941986 RepID=UPI0011911E6E|nr:sugar-binding domain-containing protein [Amycolatopsis bartoniae]MBB2935891.1 beta-galactosidase/beta-glucuronidase [Amycolatopsis bartoniae]TVT02667.1 glycoside hydrolase family 2 [Amycolatopsis bartoniae]
MIDAEPEHVCPRPQLVRQGWIDLCGQWGFAFDDEDRGRTGRWYDDAAAFDRSILVPYPPESQLSGIHAPQPHAVVWYRHEFDAPPLPPGHRMLLHFGAVDYRASVWINGILVGEHEGGQTPFSFDITETLQRDRQSIVIRAEDQPADVAQPRGKQDWRPEPHEIWYHRTTGIWQPVWAEVVPELHLTELHWTPDVVRTSVTCEGTLSRAGATVRVVLRHDDEVLADQSVRVDSTRFQFEVTIPALRHGQARNRLLWSPENPVLIDATVTTRPDQGPGDEVSSYLGLRDVGVADGRFLLNHVPYYPRMVLEQGYWPESHLAAPDAQALRREVELVKELGFNGVRVHQKAEDPRFLYWCDRLGLLVWGETANAYEFGPTAVERLTQEWLEIVRRDRSHPCIVTWVPLNESWGVSDIASSASQEHFARSLYHLTKAIDPARPVISNDGWETPDDSDVYGIHDYAPTGSSLRSRYGGSTAIQETLASGRPGGRRLVLGVVDVDRPVMLTEFGGLTYAPAEGENWFGYSTVTDGADLVRKLDDLVTAVLDSPALAGFCYTQLTDTEQERNGLLTADRSPKADPAEIRAVLTKPTKALPGDELRYHRENSLDQY